VLLWQGHFVLSRRVLPLSRETDQVPDISKWLLYNSEWRSFDAGTKWIGVFPNDALFGHSSDGGPITLRHTNSVVRWPRFVSRWLDPVSRVISTGNNNRRWSF
jgi:hypothetical protein